MEYRNARNMSIYVANIGVQVKPFGTVNLNEKQAADETILRFINDGILVLVDRAGGVALPPGVSPSPEEFGTIITAGPKNMPGLGEAKTLEEVITVEGQKVQENLDAVGEDLKKKSE